MKIIERVCKVIWVLGILVQAIGVIIEACGNDDLGHNISIIGSIIFIVAMLSLSIVYMIDNMKKVKSIEASGGIDMSNDNKLDSKLRQGLQARLDRIWEDTTELRIMRNCIENELCDDDTDLIDEEFKWWLKAQHWALGKAMDALVQQKNVINAVMVNPNVFDKADTADHLSDTAEVIEKLKKEDSDLTRRLEKLNAFLNDDNKTARVCEYQLKWMKYQHKLMVEYHRTLMNRIFDLQGHQHKE